MHRGGVTMDNGKEESSIYVAYCSDPNCKFCEILGLKEIIFGLKETIERARDEKGLLLERCKALEAALQDAKVLLMASGQIMAACSIADAVNNIDALQNDAIGKLPE